MIDTLYNLETIAIRMLLCSFFCWMVDRCPDSSLRDVMTVTLTATVEEVPRRGSPKLGLSVKCSQRMIKRGVDTYMIYICVVYRL